MNIRELRQRRAALIEEARGLLDACEREKRSALNDREQRRYNEVVAEANRLAQEINELDSDHEPVIGEDMNLRQAAEDLNRIGGRRSRDGQPGAGSGAGLPGYRDQAPWQRSDGLVPALAPEQRMVDLVAPQHAQALQSGELSAGRFLRSIVTGRWSDAPAEHEAIRGYRAQSVGLDAMGGFLVPEVFSSQIIDLARNQTRVLQAGAQTIPMPGPDLALAKVVTAPTAGWKGENQPGEVSDMTFGRTTLHASTLFGMIKSSVELFEDSPNTGDLAAQELATSLSLELDRVGLVGRGAALEPLGVSENQAVQRLDLGTDGDFLEVDDLTTAIAKIWNANGPTEGLAAIMAPRTAAWLEAMKDGDGNPVRWPESVTKLRKLVTNQVPTDLTHGAETAASEVYLGDWRQMLIGMRTELRIEVSREAADSSGSAFRNLQIFIRAYLRADIGYMHSKFFTVIEGIKPGLTL